MIPLALAAGIILRPIDQGRQYSLYKSAAAMSALSNSTDSMAQGQPQEPGPQGLASSESQRQVRSSWADTVEAEQEDAAASADILGDGDLFGDEAIAGADAADANNAGANASVPGDQQPVQQAPTPQGSEEYISTSPGIGDSPLPPFQFHSPAGAALFAELQQGRDTWGRAWS